MCQFLCGVSIPKYILDLPVEVLSTPFGQTLAPLIDSLDTPREGGNTFSFEPQIAQRASSPGFDELNSQIEQARLESIALEERRRTIKDKVSKKVKKEKKEKSSKKKSKNSSPDSDQNSTSMSEVENTEGVNGSNGQVPAEMLPSERAIEDEAEERRKEEERKRLREPPIVYKEVDVSTLLYHMYTMLYIIYY